MLPTPGERGADFRSTNPAVLLMQKTLFLLATALLIHLGAVKTQAAPNISVDFFYDQLGDYGDWVEVGDYGYGWQPRDADPDWRPYSDGRWAYTEAGWTWLSEEPYGWAVYHYGRWAQIEHKGWVWIPGTEWAPAWVSWRRSPQHVGWAPLPPEASFRRSVGISGWADSYYDIGPSAYRFVEVRNFGAPRLRTVFVEPRENITIIRQTTNITRITYVNSVVHNEGPRYEDISRESAEPIRRLRLDRRVEIEGDRNSFRGEQMRSRVDGDSLRVFAPGFDARAAAPPQKLSAKIEKVEINRGWKDAGPAADVEKLRAKVRGEAKAPKELPPQPRFEKLAEQKAAPELPPTKGKPVAAAPGETPRGEKMKDGRKGKELPIAPVAPPVESKVAPLEHPIAPEAPMKPQKPGKTGKTEKATDAEVPSLRPAAPARTEEKPERVVPPGAEPANPERKGKSRKQPELPRPTPVDPVEPKIKPDRPDARRELPPTPDQPAPKKERSFPAEPAPRREAPEPPKNEPRKPKMERPEAAREVPPAVERAQPKAERQNRPNVAPGNVPQPAPRGEAEKSKPGKGKAKDDKKPEDEAPKAQ
jgi:hypothetical protein